MNQEQVKENLLKLHECKEDFTLVFSGKKNGKVNGFYKFATKEIVIHDRNFLNEDDETLNENLLMFTAIHELAHHLCRTELGQKNDRAAHNAVFWQTFNDLTDKAEELAIYHPVISENTQELIDEARSISLQIAELQRKQGEVLVKLQEACEKDGLRYEDMVERKAQIAKETERESVRAYQIGEQTNGLGADIQEAAVKARNEETRDAIIQAGKEGKSVIQAKQAAKSVPAKAPVENDETAALKKEAGRIKKSIENLTHRLEEIEEQLTERSEAAKEPADDEEGQMEMFGENG
jgi:hypothetical protein